MSENADEPKIVYHYTTLDTMMKIAKTATIWATSINYLNDVSEGEYFGQLVRERIPVYQATHQVDASAMFDEFLKTSSERVSARPFVASFSEDGDSLPQWRSYCPNGNGIAIGLRVDCLKRSFVNTDGGEKPSALSPRFLKVSYLDTMTPESLDREITSAIELTNILFSLAPNSLWCNGPKIGMAVSVA